MIEVLEPRWVLSAATNVVNVSIVGNFVSLTDTSSGRAAQGDSFDVAYTTAQVTLTGRNGTTFLVAGQSKSSHTFNTSQPIHLSVYLNSPASTVQITGDGQASLASLDINFGWIKSANALTMTKMKADSVLIVGSPGIENVTLDQSTVNGSLLAYLGRKAADSLRITNSTVKGDFVATAQQLSVDHATFEGVALMSQVGYNAHFDTTASTYNGAVQDVLGRDAVVNTLFSADGKNVFHGVEILVGSGGRHRTTLNTSANAVVNDVSPTLINVDKHTTTAVPATPTVHSVTAGVAPATVTGTWDSAQSQTLKVTVGGKTFVRGVDTELTTPTSGNWSLNVAGVSLPKGATTVNVVSANAFGDSTQGTGTITLTVDPAELVSIHRFLTDNQLTGQQTSSGLNYVITQSATGAIPTSGQKVTANYSGFLLNADGTLGTEFDSNIDAQFNHVSPFQFTLGQGQVIAGWDEAFALLPIGTKAKLLIPSPLGYGAQNKPNIPPNSILVFDVTVVSVP